MVALFGQLICFLRTIIPIIKDHRTQKKRWSAEINIKLSYQNDAVDKKK